MSIAVSAASASGGYIVPNDHVDVVLSHEGPSGQISETILENVGRPAIGARLGETGDTGAVDPEKPGCPCRQVLDTTIATLELDPVQGETIINASKIGPLSLALRSISDFSADAGATTDQRRTRNQAIRVIRYGVEQNIMAGSTVPSVDPATFAEPATTPVSPSGEPAAPRPPVQLAPPPPVVPGESL